MKSGMKKKIGVLAGVLLLSVFFNNCAATHDQVTDAGDNQSLDAATQICKDQLLAAYSTSVYSFFTTVGCQGCHGNSPISPNAPSLANSNVSTSFQQFQNKGIDGITVSAQNGHGGSVTSKASNDAALQTAKTGWASAQSTYTQCIATASIQTPTGTPVGTGTEPSNLITSLKSPTTIFNATTTQTLTWNLATAADLDSRFTMRSIPMTFSITVKRIVSAAGAWTGYEFSNPSVTLKDATNPYTLSGVIIFINGQAVEAKNVDAASAYLYISKRVSTTTALSLRTDIAGNATATVQIPLPNANIATSPAMTDMISVEILRLEKMDGSLGPVVQFQ
jgi:hypothetical protein